MALENLLNDVRVMRQYGPGVPVTVPPELVKAVTTLMTISRGQQPKDKDYAHGLVWSGGDGYLTCYFQRYTDGWHHLYYPGLNRIVHDPEIVHNTQVWDLVGQWLEDHTETRVDRLDYVPDLACLTEDDL